MEENQTNTDYDRVNYNGMKSFQSSFWERITFSIDMKAWRQQVF